MSSLQSLRAACLGRRADGKRIFSGFRVQGQNLYSAVREPGTCDPGLRCSDGSHILSDTEVLWVQTMGDSHRK